VDGVRAQVEDGAALMREATSQARGEYQRKDGISGGKTRGQYGTLKRSGEKAWLFPRL
jgi:hypothetical protein